VISPRNASQDCSRKTRYEFLDRLRDAIH
jgi:hypothetical protein